VTRCIGRCVLVLATFGASSQVARSDYTTESVRDDAGLFRPEIIAQADKGIRELFDRYHVDLRIETLSLPDGERQTVERMRQKARSDYFAKLAAERAKEADVNGLYILICANPSHVQVTAYPDSAGALFYWWPRKEIHDSLRRTFQGVREGAGRHDAAEAAVGFGFRARPATGGDAALLATVEKVTELVQRRVGDPNAVPVMPVVVVLAAGVGAWVLFSLLSQRMSKRSPHEGLFVPMQPDRGPALLAARFGSPGAFWLYDRLFYGPPGAPGDDVPVVDSAQVAHRESKHHGDHSDLLHPDPDPIHEDTPPDHT